jgi:hypothetical protein
MLTEPHTDYLFPKYVRRLLLVIGGLIFYAQYTIFLLGPVLFDGEPGTRVFSAWITLAYLDWTSPADIRVPHLHLLHPLFSAGVGSLFFFLSATIRRGFLSGLIRLLCIPFAVFMAYAANEARKVETYDYRTYEPIILPFGDNTASIGDSQVEMLLGFTMPLFLCLIMFWVILAITIQPIATALCNRWHKPRLKARGDSELP